MNISDITVKGAAVSGRSTAFGTDSFLNIGKRGQTVEGTVSNVSGRISINFNGVEVTVSKSAVQNATEGETRKFKIMDVSKDSIVLKEVGNTMNSEGGKSTTGTFVSASSYHFSDYLADSQKVSEAKHQAGQNLSVLTGEDYQNIESEQGALEQYKESALDRAIERKKEKHQWEQERAEEYHQVRQEVQENQEKIQSSGFLEQKTTEQIVTAMEAANLPVSNANVARVNSALQMAQIVKELSDTARAYIVENHLAPTIENLYHGQYSGSGGVSASVAEEETWQTLLPQVNQILAENGLDSDLSLEHAKWLFANELPITVESIRMMQTLDGIQEKMYSDQVLEQILQAMSAGAVPEKASLDISQFVIAQGYLKDFANVTTQDITLAVQMASGEDITLELLKQAKSSIQDNTEEQPEELPIEKTSDNSGSEIAVITAKRQLEEIRLNMTLQSAVKMSAKGIDIEVTSLKQLVDELRQIENAYYTKEVGKENEVVTDEQTNLMQEALEKAIDIKTAPAAILGSSVRQQELLTLNRLHSAAVSATVQMEKYQTDYEAVGTQVRSDLGDSIQKAFTNIPELLEDLGLEDTQANERAVRILGYNRMEITQESITRVKEYDAQVNAIINNMKPSVVLELIRRGDNPMEIPLSDLDNKLQQIAEDQDIGSEEKYSRFLWQLEQENSITLEERDSYIGIYRLLNQIDKTDGAAVGAVLDADKKMTLGNLLTAVRTIRGKGIDTKIDDDFGELKDIPYTSQSISAQIESGFNQQTEQQAGDRNQQRYYDQMVQQVLKQITPSAVQQISDGDMEKLLNTSLETLKEQLESAQGNPELEHTMYEQLARQIREAAAKDADVVKYLNQMNIPDTMANIQAAEQILEQGYDIQKEVYNRRKNLPEEEKKEYETTISEMADCLDSEETMMASFEKLGDFMEKVLEASYEQKEVTSFDLRSLKLLGQGIQLQKQMVQRQSYDIPILTGDTVTSLNVTLIQGSEENGKVQISITSANQREDGFSGESTEKEDVGNISIELRLARGEIKGLVLCDSRDSFERLSDGKDSVISQLEESGFSVKNLSYSMDYQSRIDMAGTTEQPATSQLYRIAKIMVQNTMQILK